MLSSVLMFSVGIPATLLCWIAGNTHAFEAVGKTPKQTEVRRQDNLDHWDSDTLAYYLDNYPGYDQAVMFYAKWDTNSHQLAPYWNKHAVTLDAGTTQSKLIMALFDCELNDVHIQLCSAAGITHYPTMMFIGSGPFHDTDPISRILFGKKSAGMMGASPIPNTVKYQGNWQLVESILDWIKTMQALSRWHIWSTEGFGRRLRTFLLPKRKKNEQLPLGIPGGVSSFSSSAAAANKNSGTSSGSSDETVAHLEKQVDVWKNATDEMTKVATRAATMMSTVLFGGDSTDMYALLDESKAWTTIGSYDNLNDIHRACVLETSLDYCQRLADPVATKVVDDLIASKLSEEELLAASENIEALILDALAKEEPYCAILDECIASEMKDEACRPKTCPFTNDLACRLLVACKDPTILKEYAEALKVDIVTS